MKLFSYFVCLFIIISMFLPSTIYAQWIQQGNKITPPNDAIGVTILFGYSVDFSADGNTAIVGGTGDNNYDGAAWIYTRINGIWTPQAKLIGTGAVGKSNQGISVAISADGNTAIVGGSGDNSNIGAVWIFVRSGEVWTQQGDKLVGTGSVGTSLQGGAVSLSADGNTAIVGGSRDNTFAGAVWIFTRNGNVWTQQGNKIVVTDAIGNSAFGNSVDISADGNTVIVGGRSHNQSRGAAWIFVRSGGIWSQQGNKLIGTGSLGLSRQGEDVSISADGNTAIVGGPSDNSSAGAIWVFTRNGDVWSQQGNKLVVTDALGTSQFGISADLSADGNTAVIGGSADNVDAGATWIFIRSDSVWSQLGNKLIGSDAVGKAYQGGSVAISSSGNIVIIGGRFDNSNLNGAAWIFVPGTTSIEQISDEISMNFMLSQNYPNPFNPSTKISWQSPVAGYQTVKVYDVLGNEVAVLVNEFKEAGRFEVQFNASQLPSGIYFYKLIAGSFTETKKMILIK